MVMRFGSWNVRTLLQAGNMNSNGLARSRDEDGSKENLATNR
jgi:hypothetical protein